MTQTIIETKISDMIRTNRLPGAFIFEGMPDDTNMLANNLARSVACLDLDYKKTHGIACMACSSCLKSLRGSHPDITIAEPEDDGARSFHIAKVREIIDDLYLSPNESSKKIYIIRDMQNMTLQGQNALLKSLEEPPEFAVFIITVTNLDLVLETVRSRAVKFKIENKKSIDADNQAIFSEVIKNILVKNADVSATYQDVLKNIDKFGKNGVIGFYAELENAVRDILISKIFAGDSDLGNVRFLYFNTSAYLETVKTCAKDYSAKKVLELIKKIRHFKSDLEHNANIRLNMTLFFGEMT